MQDSSAAHILTIEEVASYLRVSERTVYEWASKGEIPCGKIGASWRFKRDEIERWVSSRLGGRSRYTLPPPSVTIAGSLTPHRCVICEHSTKVEVLNEMIDVLAGSPHVHDRDQLAEAVFGREQLMSTGIGLNIGLPHVRLPSVNDITMGLGVTPRPVTDYESLDGEPVRVVVMIAAGEKQHAEHVRLLSLVSARLKEADVRRRLIGTTDPERLYGIMAE